MEFMIMFMVNIFFGVINAATGMPGKNDGFYFCSDGCDISGCSYQASSKSLSCASSGAHTTFYHFGVETGVIVQSQSNPEELGIAWIMNGDENLFQGNCSS